jgi:hypothetical protein
MAADHVFEFRTVATLAPTAVNDAPAANSEPGDPFHAHLNCDPDTLLCVPIVISTPGLLENDVIGLPVGQITSFGGGSLGGAVTSFSAGQTVPVGLNGELTVNANGGVALRPSIGFNGEFTFQYRLTNAIGSSDATVTIFVGPRF